MTGTVQIRPATVADAAAISAIYAMSWPLSVAHVAAPEVQAALLADRDTTFWAAQISEPHAMFLLGSADGVPVGFVGWTTSTVSPELVWLFLAPPAQGTGLATALHDNAVADMKTRGAQRAHLWAVPGNARAEAFYARYGWKIGSRTKPVATAEGEFPLRRWVREL